MKKIKKKSIIILFVIVLVVVVGGFIGFKTYKYMKSNEYKLKELGYQTAEITSILKMEPNYMKTIFSLEYSEHIVPLFQEKYFILSNLNRYLTYKAKNKDKSYSDTVSVVNVEADRDWYNDPVATDMDKGELILVNKFHYLVEGYQPEDLVNMNLQYAFTGKKIRTDVYGAFKRMVNTAKKEGLTIVANSSFRTYEYQEGLYTSYKGSYGKEYADNYAARPGHSEHQTGLSIDISTLNSTMDSFEDTLEFTWLQEHAHEYGFILRYPKNKEFITGYNYESWHYRYVGEAKAKEIKNLGITFDEYYAYYLDN